ncbi:CD63 antigen-like [Paramacrobiotus metropolitanus]|uniref:CD63 antigen-like n=1 Tax=Paramacrobiotus metropolitanus TaxID=2943436 RepID=UPI002445D9C7|nr:CD63 antigen-like [Paramacrobiotus metropolitanus]XP_055339470.1 CD63 antigen-like [Paramacrobiotus metropolitanus]XP_055339471.1 CD63 antigen-like [Paramacrobiotus metropolitanus]
MGAGQKVVKWLMLIFNLIFWISGIGLIIAGAVAQTVYKPYLAFLESTYLSAPVLLIVVGAVITIIAFFGCCGSAKENYCMLITFAVLLGIIFCVELAGGIAGYVERGRVGSYLESKMRTSLARYNASLDEKAWNDTQTTLKCCGVDEWHDWLNRNSSRVNGTITGPKVPESCCKQPASCDTSTVNLQQNCVPPGDHCPIYQTGCYKQLREQLESSIGIIGGVGIGVAFIQIVGIAFACFLARRVKRGYTYA